MAPVIAVETFESNVVANKKFGKGSSVITLVFTAIDLQVMPNGAPTEVTIGGTTAGLTLKSNVVISGTTNKARRYTYDYLLGATPVDGLTIGYAIKVVDIAGNQASANSATSDLITIGTLNAGHFSCRLITTSWTKRLVCCCIRCRCTSG